MFSAVSLVAAIFAFGGKWGVCQVLWKEVQVKEWSSMMVVD